MKVKLHTSITLLLVGLTILTVSLMATSSYYFSTDSADQLRARILDDTERGIYGEIVQLLKLAQKQVITDRERIDSGEVEATDFPRLAQSWIRPMETHPELAFIAILLENGDAVRIARSADRRLYIQEWRTDPQTKTLSMTVYTPQNFPSRPEFSLKQEEIYDLRRQPWYKTARNARRGELVWTESYAFRNVHGRQSIPGVACITPLYRKDGPRIGFARAGVDVLEICRYLQSLPVGHQGIAFVVELHNENTHSVIAHPSADTIWRDVTNRGQTGDRELVPVSEISDPRIRAFMAQLPPVIQRGDETTFMPIRFGLGDNHYVGGYQYLRGTDTPEWLICILMPEREIMANVWRNNWSMFGIGLSILVLAVLASLYLARQIARPLERIVAETRAVGQFDVAPRPAVASRVLEINDLGVAVEAMKIGLRSFKKYVPSDLARTLIRRKQEAVLGGTSRNLTIFFSDVVEFTAISENRTPSELVEHLSEYLSAMSAQIVATGGTVDKYIGDAIMAFWGAPQENPQHALAACTAAVRSQMALRELREKWQRAEKPLFAARMGLNTGEVVVGNIGSETRLNYTVIGDAVNVASRLEHLCKYYGTEIIISDSTYQAAGKAIVTRPLDWVFVKGKKRALLVHELLGLRGEVNPKHEEMAQVYAEGLSRYRQQDWERAMESFSQVLGLHADDGPSQRMLARCRDYLAQPPGGDWDGVHRVSAHD
jgi:adenylate cyclase